MRPPSPLTSVLLVLVCAAPAAASLDFKKTLVLRGHALDADGRAIKGAQVLVEGDRRAKGRSNGRGEFELSVPLGTAGDLRRGPLRFSLGAERRGWRFSFGEGREKLAVEIELEVARGGMARCVARSNDDRLAASAAKLMALEGDAIASLDLDLLGTKGAAARERATAPDLDYVAKTTLWIDERGGPSPHEMEAGDSDSSAADISVVESRPRAPRSEARKKPPRRPSEAEKALAEIRARMSRDSAAAEARLQREHQRAAKAARTPAKAAGRRAQEPRPAPPAASAPADAARGAASPSAGLPELQGPSPSQAADDSLIAEWRDAQWRPPGSEPRAKSSKRKRGDRTEGAPAARAESGKREPVATRTGDRPGEAASPASPSPGPPSEGPAPSPATEGPALSSEPPDEPKPGRGPQIFPEPPMHSSRSRARPLVIRAEREATTPDSCRCRVEGTIEVQSDTPLKNPERIEVWLNWYPQRRDTVELFMGSPRPFVIPGAPCGPQRLRLRALGSAQFDVISREAMAGFRCDGGSIQRRIVLAPRRPSPASPMPGEEGPAGR